MRKRVTGSNARIGVTDQEWLRLEEIATVEVTSEQTDFPVEAALNSTEGQGWRAGENGEQRIRLIFDEPVSIRQVRLVFFDASSERTQEFSLRWSSFAGGTNQEIVRQQWNFGSASATTEIENYVVDLADVSSLELTIRPDINNENAVATLKSWRLR
jgi:hypothetical protein